MRVIGFILACALVLLIAAAANAATTAQKLHKSQTTVAWYEGKGAWHLRPGFKKCAQLRFRKPERRCTRHRRVYRFHAARVEKLTPKPVVGPLGNVSAWLCIHSGEGAWNANTGNGYYGGSQMDWSFMSAYGPELLASKGTADNWTPAEQMMVAERARASGRGYYPWPTTARRCGLI